MNIFRTILIGIAFSMVLPGVSYAASQTFTSSGSFTVPAGVTSLTATVIGGGGGGGGAWGRGDNHAGGGAGSGGYVSGTYAVTPGENISVTVGQGGTPATWAFNYNYVPDGTYSEQCDYETGSCYQAPNYSVVPNYLCPTAGTTGTKNGNNGSSSSVSGSPGTVTATGGEGGHGSGSLDPNASSGGDVCDGYSGAGGSPGGVAGGAINCTRNSFPSTPGGYVSSSGGTGGSSNGWSGSTPICPVPGQAGKVILDWTTPSVGTVNVSSNISSSWTITGPATITGSGTSQSSPSKPTGTYTITWGTVSGYTAPSTQSLTLTNGSTITFTGTYTAVPALPPEPTFNATCTLQANGTYNVALTWNAVTPVTNYPVRLRGPSHATTSSPSYPIGLSGTTDVIGWGTAGDAPTSLSLTFTGITAAGTYEYWGHAWSSTNGWSTNTVKTVPCASATPSSCAYNGSISWGTGCSATVNVSTPSGGSVTITNSASGYTGSATYQCTNSAYAQTSSSCSPSAAASCTLPWGGTIADGASVTAYQSASVTSPATCTSQTRTCSNGSLPGSYLNQSCSVTGSGATGTINAPNCTISAGASTCSTTVTWSTSSVTSAQVFKDGVSFSTALSGSSAKTVGYTSSSFTLFDRTPSPDVQLDADTARGTCASGSGWNGSYCELGYLPDLTADTGVSPLTAQPGVSSTFTATIRNIGPVTSGSNFDNFIQIATATNGGGTLTDLGSASLNSLAAGASNTISKSYTFPSAGTYSARACADKRNRNDDGKIDEKDENNNCGNWVDITVAAPPAAAPTATLTANPTSIDPGQTSQLTWSSTNATSCTFADTGSVATSGSRNVSPAVNSTYSITCTGTGGTSAPALAIVTVLTPDLSLKAAPPRVKRGSTTTITWSAGNVKNCSITKNGAAWKSGSANGSHIYAGSSVETISVQTTYLMTCTDVNGKAYSGSVQVVLNLVPDFLEF